MIKLKKPHLREIKSFSYSKPLMICPAIDHVGYLSPLFQWELIIGKLSTFDSNQRLKLERNNEKKFINFYLFLSSR